MNPAQIQIQIENEMESRGIDSYRRKVQLNIEKGRASDNSYAVHLIKAGLQPLSDEIQKFVDRAWRGKPGPKAIAAKLLQKFPNQDVVAYITWKAVLDLVSSEKATATAVSIKIGSLLEDELRFSVFQQNDPKFFQTLKNHISDTKHPGYRRTMMLGHMRNYGYEFERWSKEDKLRVGLKLIELLMHSVGLVKMATRGNFHNKTRKTYLEFTEEAMTWIKRQRSNRLAAYPLLMPCLIQPRDWPDGGFYSERLRRIKEVKTADTIYLNDLRNKKPIAFYESLNALQGTEWAVNEKVLEIANYCWNTSTPVGCLIDAEAEPLPPKPFDIADNEVARKKWRREASIIHDLNAHNRAKRFQCMMMLDTSEKFSEGSFWHVAQADFTGRIYPVSGTFNPQTTDLSRGLHHFKEGGPIKNKKDADWLGIAGANHWGLNKKSFQERIEWAYNEGKHIAIDVAGNPEGYVGLWSKADEPFQFFAWCLEWSQYQEEGLGFISRHPVLLDGSNNGFQHLAALTLDQDLAASVNLLASEEPQDLYNNIRTNLIVNLADSDSRYAKDWFNHRELITRKLVKKPVMMIPYSGTVYGIANTVKDYVAKEKIEFPWGTDSFKHYFFLATKIKESVDNVCPTASKIMNYLNGIARCFAKEDKTIEWTTPSGFFVKQSYFITKRKRIETKLGYNRIDVALQENTKDLDKKKTTQSFPANFIHSLDAANVHLALQKAKAKGLNQFTTIHDCFGAPASDIEDFINCAKESFVEIYQDYVLDDLYNQAAKQLKDPAKLPSPLEMGELHINEVMSSPYVFS